MRTLTSMKKGMVDDCRGEVSSKKEPPIKGVVTIRKCEHCGHHEIGIITEEGQSLPLKPGKVQLIEE